MEEKSWPPLAITTEFEDVADPMVRLPVLFIRELLPVIVSVLPPEEPAPTKTLEALMDAPLETRSDELVFVV